MIPSLDQIKDIRYDSHSLKFKHFLTLALFKELCVLPILPVYYCRAGYREIHLLLSESLTEKYYNIVVYNIDSRGYFSSVEDRFLKIMGIIIALYHRAVMWTTWVLCVECLVSTYKY